MQTFHPFLGAQILVLLAVANGAPLIAKKILGSFLGYPLDGGITLGDGEPLFGPSKTIRGIALSIVVTALAAPLIGFDWTIGFIVAAMAMAGDLCSSFLKRRMKLPSGSMALGLDQVPESLLPAIACRWVLPVSLLDIVLVTGLFFAGELIVSRALYRLNIRDRPY
ncbi:MAG: CDP-archaeol synthase [Beijerinckiaceae bacterium]|nr:CDP-archaeol synthase [Beijerinckiaceae bacterium]